MERNERQKSLGETINAEVKTTPANPKTKQIVQDYKKRTEERRSNEKKADQSNASRKVVEVLMKNNNNNINMYTCTHVQIVKRSLSRKELQDM